MPVRYSGLFMPKRPEQTKFKRGRPQRRHLKNGTCETASNCYVSHVPFFLVPLREDQAGAAPVEFVCPAALSFHNNSLSESVVSFGSNAARLPFLT